MKVKILYSSHIMTLEIDINRWLDSHGSVEVIDIKYAVGDQDAATYRYSAMIIYKK